MAPGAAQIAQMRVAVGWSIAEMAERCGVDPSIIGQWESQELEVDRFLAPLYVAYEALSAGSPEPGPEEIARRNARRGYS